MRIMIVGLGSIGVRHLINFHALVPEAELFVFRRVNNIPLESHPATDIRLPFYQTITDLEHVAKLNLDLVVVANPSIYHVESLIYFYRVTSALILVEKPCACNSSQLGMLEEIETCNRVFVAQQLRFHPISAILKKIIHSKFFGNLFRFDITHSEHISLWHPWEDFRISYATQSELGGGSFLTQNHGTDLAHFLLGASTSCSTLLGDGSHLSLDCDEMFVSTVTYLQPHGSTIGTIRGDFLGHPPMLKAHFDFERGRVFADFREHTIEVQSSKQNKVKVVKHVFGIDRNLPFMELARSVIRYCDGTLELAADERLPSIGEATKILRIGISSIVGSNPFTLKRNETR